MQSHHTGTKFARRRTNLDPGAGLDWLGGWEGWRVVGEGGGPHALRPALGNISFVLCFCCFPFFLGGGRFSIKESLTLARINFPLVVLKQNIFIYFVFFFPFSFCLRVKLGDFALTPSFRFPPAPPADRLYFVIRVTLRLGSVNTLAFISYTVFLAFFFPSLSPLPPAHSPAHPCLLQQ